MMQQAHQPEQKRRLRSWSTTALGRSVLSVFAAVVTVWLLWEGFVYLRDAKLPQWLSAILVIIWGVGGVLALFTVANLVIEQFSTVWQHRILPYVFVGPAVALLIGYLAVPTLRTLYSSFWDAKGEQFVGLANYAYAFTNRDMLLSFRNNLLFWLILGTGFSVVFGLLIAVIADRTHPTFERVCKALIFMPMAISMVGASVIWKFIYDFRPAGSDQIGLLNAVVTALGGQPKAWLLLQPWNNLFLVAIMIWLQTGYSMVLFSAAIKGMPAALLEAGRIDGANEFQLFFGITLPYIRGTVVTVATTITLATLKVFDIVQSMTGGNFGTQVIANVQYTQMFRQFNYGRAAAIAIVLLLMVLPLMYYNVRQFNRQTEEAFK